MVLQTLFHYITIHGLVTCLIFLLKVWKVDYQSASHKSSILKSTIQMLLRSHNRTKFLEAYILESLRFSKSLLFFLAKLLFFMFHAQLFLPSLAQNQSVLNIHLYQPKCFPVWDLYTISDYHVGNWVLIVCLRYKIMLRIH